MLQERDPTGPVVAFTARFRAPRDKVFEAWTTPAILQKWFFSEAGFTTSDVEVALQPLGPYQLVITPVDGGEATRIHGNFVDIQADRHLTYTWTGACAGEQYWTLVNVRFADDGDGSRIELDHGVFWTDADRAMHEQGWLACISSLSSLLGEA